MMNKKEIHGKNTLFKILTTVFVMVASITCSGIHNVYATNAVEITYGQGATDGEYVIKDSDKTEIDASSLVYLTADQLRIARNEIYARHGRMFKDTKLQSYFNSRSWYKGSIAPDSFDENCLNKTESKNVSKILKAEKKLSDSSEYIIHDSNSVYLTESNLKYLTMKQLRLARNEIYARHGRLFNDSELQNYFNSRSWYSGTIAADDFFESVFNSYEEKNIDLICKIEKSRKGGTAGGTNNGGVTIADFLGDYRSSNDSGLSLYESESSPTGYGIATFIFSTDNLAEGCERVRCIYPTNVLSYSIDGCTLTLTSGYDSPESTISCVLDENHGLTVTGSSGNTTYYIPYDISNL